jgi:hypothetical protein
MTRAGAIAENIALLSMLDKQLELPTSESSPAGIHSRQQQSSHSLPFKHEKQIAKAFAVLLAYNNSAKKVGAVCVEELPDESGIIIRTAVNAGGQEMRMEPFDNMARVIVAASTSGKRDRVKFRYG